MAMVGLAVALPATLLLRDAPEEESATSSTERAAPAQRSGSQLGVVQAKADSGLGVRYRVPRSWRSSKEASTIQLRSRDRSVAISISSPAGDEEAEGVLDSALDALRENYRRVRIDRGSRRKLGNLSAKGGVVRARTDDGVRLRILVAVAEGKRRSYLVEVFTAAGAPSMVLAQAQEVLESLRFRK